MVAIIEQRDAGLGRAFKGIAIDRRDATAAADIFSVAQPNVRFFIIRHGESLGQIDISAYKSPGDALIPLTAWGKLQSLEAGRFLKGLAESLGLDNFELFSSTCLRTGQTREQVAAGLGETLIVSQREDTRLDKQLFGIFAGLFSDKEKAELYPAEFADYQRQLDDNGLFHARPFGGESIADVQRKASDFVRHILETTPQDGAVRNVIVVTHGLPALCVENALLHHGENWVLANMDRSANCSIKLVEGYDPAFTAQEVGKGLKRPSTSNIHPPQPLAGANYVQ